MDFFCQMFTDSFLVGNLTVPAECYDQCYISSDNSFLDYITILIDIPVL